MAAQRPGPPSLLIDGPRDSTAGRLQPAQYTSAAFADLAGDCQVSLSVGRKGQCWDNAVAESFFASLKG